MVTSILEEKTSRSTYDIVRTKIEARNFSSRHVPAEVKRKILDAARLTGTGMNSQHWRFVLVQDKSRLKRLADDSTTGLWVEKADFAIIVLTNPKYAFHMLDAGRAIQDTMVTAWSFGVASGLYTGFNVKAMVADFDLPKELHLTAAVGFGYPKRSIIGKKDRHAVEEVAFLDRYGNPLRL